MTPNATSEINTADREIIQRRLLNAPRQLVYKVWTGQEHLAKWWGPNGFTTTTHEMNFAPGGTWRFMMHGPDGTDYPNKMVFEEVIPNQKLVFTHSDDADNGLSFHVTVTFEEKGDKTLLTMHHVFGTAEERNMVVEKFGAIEGGRQTLTRLEEHLYNMGTNIFTIERTFNAPRELVFKAMTEYDRLAKWWGPKGAVMTTGTQDLRPGGNLHYKLRGEDGSEMWGLMSYREIISPERLVFIVSFSDEQANIVHHPMAPTWPLEILNIMTFTEHDGKTTLTIAGGAVNATEEEHATYKAGQESMRTGFGGSFDKLDDYLLQTQ
jgi:uncharacterized protein YndB with AHSA1/START domain